MNPVLVGITFLLTLYSTRAAELTKTNGAAAQEICLLINVIDHDYEKISARTFEQIHSIGYRTIELGNYTEPFSPELSRIYQALEFQTLASDASLAELQKSLDAIIARWP